MYETSSGIESLDEVSESSCPTPKKRARFETEMLSLLQERSHNRFARTDIEMRLRERQLAVDEMHNENEKERLAIERQRIESTERADRDREESNKLLLQLLSKLVNKD